MPNQPLDRMPVQSIIMWYGMSVDIPYGWRICDGNAGTPNLVGKFVKAVGKDKDNRKPGGKEEITLETKHIPSHSHGFQNIYKWKRSFKGETSGPNTLTAWNGSSDQSLYAGETHNAGESKAFPNDPPPYVGLYFIMKVKDR